MFNSKTHVQVIHLPFEDGFGLKSAHVIGRCDMLLLFSAVTGCPNLPIFSLGKSPIKWRQCHDMTRAVNWDVKH